MVAALLAASVASPAQALHSVPSFPYFWDNDVDGRAEATDAAVKLAHGGSGWTSSASSRLAEAAATWANNTDFNPSVATSNNLIYVDGRQPLACGLEWAELNEPIAVTCRSQTYRGTYYQITNAKIYLNEWEYSFYYGSSTPGSSSFDVRGILTHEIGHVIRLIDLYGSNCPPGPTMCGAVNSGSESSNLRSLTADDRASADAVYLP